jgi:hypothetical protein
MGRGSEIRNPEKTYYGSGSRGKKALDPGSGSATVVFMTLKSGIAVVEFPIAFFHRFSG